MSTRIAVEESTLDPPTVERVVSALERLKAAHLARMKDHASNANPAPYLTAFNRLQGVAEALHHVRGLDQGAGYLEFPR